MLTPFLKLAAPVVILAGGFAGATWLHKTAPTVPTQVPDPAVPVVAVRAVEQGPLTLRVRGHATVQAARSVDLVAEVAARVLWVAPALEAGGFVDQDAELMHLDETDFRLAESSALARLAQSEAALQLEAAEAEIAIAEWRAHGEGEAPALVAREPQLARARADVQSAEAALAAARRDLARCVIRAPYDARVESRWVSEASFVAPGQPLATLVDRSRAELSMPIRLEQLAALELTLGEETRAIDAQVELDLGSQTARWAGKVVRTGARLDPRTRMAQVIVEVNQPYASTPPLIPGSFARIELEGRRVEQAVKIPRSALRDDESVLLADADDRLEVRTVEVLHVEGDDAVLSHGLLAGERLIVTPMATVVPGMPLHVADEVED